MPSSDDLPPIDLPKPQFTSPAERAAAARLLEAKFHSDIPLTATIDVHVREYAGDLLRLVAPLAPNRNVHGTGFAGSIYSLAALCGWGLIFLRLREAGVAGNLVMTQAQVRYARPVAGDLVATCDVRAHPEFEAALTKYQRVGHARIDLPVIVGDVDKPAAELTTHYVVRRPDATPP